MKQLSARLSCLILLLIASTAVLAAQRETSCSDSTRQHYGVVLSGGGAKGLAHIGLLELIDSLQIQVDYLSGTSMGAVLAGLYSIGYSGAEIKEMVLREDWSHILSNQIPYDKVDMREKEDYAAYALELPIRKGLPRLPSSLIEGQYMMELLLRYTHPARGIQDYDKLPIPLRLVASDVAKGGAVVMDSGSLPLSIRASLAIPAAFAPAVVGGKLLVDGGLDRNFPVEEVRSMGADHVIGSYTGSRLRDVEELTHSPVGVIYQSYALLTKQEVERQSCLVNVMLDFSESLSRHTSSDFAQRKRIIAIGEEEAHKLLPQLMAIKEQQRAEGIHYTRRRLPERPIPISGIKITDEWGKPISAEETEFVHSVIGDDLALLDSADYLQSRIDALMGYNRYAQVYYVYEPDTLSHEGGAVLHFFIKKKPQALLRIGAYYDPYESAAIMLNGSLRDLLLTNSRLSVKVAISKHPKLRASYYKWLDDRYAYWISPYLSLRMDYCDDLSLRYLSQIESHAEATFYQASARGGLMAGHALTPQSELTMGVQYGANYIWQPSGPFEEEMRVHGQATGEAMLPRGYFNQLLRANRPPRIGYFHGTWTMQLAYRQNSLNRKHFATRGNNLELSAELTLQNHYSLTPLPEEATESQKQIHALLDPVGSRFPQRGPLLHLSIYEHIVAPLGGRWALHTRFFCGLNLDLKKSWQENMNFDSYLFLSQKFHLGGFANLQADNHTIFSGLRYREYPTSNLASLYMGMQYTPLKDLYITPHASVGLDILSPNPMESDLLLGAGIDIDYDSLIGPIKLSFSRSNVLRTGRFFFSLGYAF